MTERPSAETAFTASMKSIRTTQAITQAQLAERMSARGFKWHPATVYKVENGERQLLLAEAIEIARILGVPLEEMSEHSQEISQIRELVRAQRAMRTQAVVDLEALCLTTLQLGDELAKDGVQEQFSPDEYDEIFREANPSPDAYNPILDAVDALKLWGPLECRNCGRLVRHNKCEHCGFEHTTSVDNDPKA